jgi:Domain of unknown function (DUF222)
MANIFEALLEAAHLVDGSSDRFEGVSSNVSASAPFATMCDEELLAAARDIEALGKSIDVYRALIAAEVAHRSDLSFGHSGLAARMGHRTPENLVRFLTGVSYFESSKRVRVGVALNETDPGDVASSLADAIRAGEVGLDQADSILRSFGPALLGGSSEAVSSAVTQLVSDSAELDADSLARAAKIAREKLDSENSLGRETELRDKRFLKIGPEIDGMRRLHGLLDPESAAIVVAACDNATNPRRGGPRFVDPEQQARAEEIVADSRTNEQMNLDTVVDLMRAGIAVGDKATMGAIRPAIRVVISASELAKECGTGWIDGTETPISAHTVRRMACDVGWLPVMLDERGEILDVGVTQRRFPPAQRTALAVRDGGCRWPGCDLPPAWCEAHHMEEWSKGGRTSVDNGVLLCRFHHLNVHNNGWTIERHLGELRAVPPPGHKLVRKPLALPLKRRVAV